MHSKVKPNWPSVFDRFRNSGLTKEEFCRTQKISRSSFAYNLKLQRAEGSHPVAPAGVAPFLSVRGKQEFRIRINDSLTLSFDSLPDANWLSSFVKALGDSHARS